MAHSRVFDAVSGARADSLARLYTDIVFTNLKDLMSFRYGCHLNYCLGSTILYHPSLVSVANVSCPVLSLGFCVMTHSSPGIPRQFAEDCCTEPHVHIVYDCINIFVQSYHGTKKSQNKYRGEQWTRGLTNKWGGNYV